MTNPRTRATVLWALAGAAAAFLAGGAAMAAQGVSNANAQPAPRATTPSPTGPAATPQMKYMQLQAEYKGPLQDTVIQRWRDPLDGTVCYIYLPVVVQHSPPTAVGAVQYGSNNIGSISCTAGKF